MTITKLVEIEIPGRCFRARRTSVVPHSSRSAWSRMQNVPGTRSRNGQYWEKGNYRLQADYLNRLGVSPCTTI